MSVEDREYQAAAKALVSEWRAQGEKYGVEHDTAQNSTTWRQHFIEYLAEAHRAITELVAGRASLAEAQHGATVLAALGWSHIDVLDLARAELALGRELLAADNWAALTFPKMTRATVLAHLREEVEELIEADTLDDPDARRMEAADVAMLVSIYARVAQMDLARAVHDKMVINERRLWDPETGRHR